MLLVTTISIRFDPCQSISALVQVLGGDMILIELPASYEFAPQRTQLVQSFSHAVGYQCSMPKAVECRCKLSTTALVSRRTM